MTISIIAAIGRNRELGKQGQLIWRIKDDLRFFKAITMGKPVILGRKTWESIPEKFRPLPGRQNIVVSRNPHYAPTGALLAKSLTDAIDAAETVLARSGEREVFIIGGAELYAEALQFADLLYLTLIDAQEPDADAFFPPYEKEFDSRPVESSRQNEGNVYYQFVTFEKQKAQEKS